MDNNPRNLEEGFGDMNLTLSIPAELEEQSPEYEEQPEEVIDEQSTDDSNQEWASLDLTQGPGELTQHTTTIGYEPNSAKNEEVLQVFMLLMQNSSCAAVEEISRRGSSAKGSGGADRQAR